MTGLPFNTAYRIETERLLIRCWSPEDAPVLRAALDESDQHLRPWIPWMKDEPKSLDESATWLRIKRANFDLGKDFWYAIFDKEERTLIGEIGLMTRAGPGAFEIGYWINKSCEGKGHASEATAVMIRVAFEIAKVERLEIYCAPEMKPASRSPGKWVFCTRRLLRGAITIARVASTTRWSGPCLRIPAQTQPPAARTSRRSTVWADKFFERVSPGKKPRQKG